MTATGAGARAGHETGAAGSVRRAAGLSAALVGLGTGLGFARDLLMAHLYGASSGTDAFLVAWTIPETASPLLIEDAMALLMVPAFSRALLAHGGIRPLVAATLPRATAVLSAAVLAIALAAPALVELLAPGLRDPGPAILCTRLTSVTVLTFGLAGYMSAALRAGHTFGPPAFIYAAYNFGILAVIGIGHGPLGVTAAALGVAAGSVLMVAVQAPAFLRGLRPPAAPAERPPAAPAAIAGPGLAAVIPVAAYTVSRQSQVFVERYFGSSLAEGSISHLNYAQKVAQVPMVLSLLVVTVTFPRLARAFAAGDRAGARRRVEGDLVAAGAIVLVATAYLIAYAPAIVALLFEHGRFTASDTAGTAAIMRVYALGLLGQSLVGVLARVFFAHSQSSRRPVWAMAAGLAVTAAVSAAGAAHAGVLALSAANAAGITVTAALMLVGVRRGAVALELAPVLWNLGRLVAAAAAACAAGWSAGRMLAGPLPSLLQPVVGGLVVAAAFLVCAAALRVPGLPGLSGLRGMHGLRGLSGPPGLPGLARKDREREGS